MKISRHFSCPPARGWWVLAEKELRDRLRNRWVLAVAVVFAVFAVLIAYFGNAHSGEAGFRGIEITVASLSSLAIYLIPLIALLLGFDAIVGERERGTLDLLCALPIRRAEILLGKFLGLAAALALATAVGFGLALLPWITQLTLAGLKVYLIFVTSAILLGCSFLSLALCISVFARERAQASGAAIAVWFGFVLVFDLLLLGLLVLAASRGGSAWAAYAMFLNPADLFRIFNLYGTDVTRTAFGLATLLPAHWNNPLLLLTGLLGWIVAPLLLALWRFR